MRCNSSARASADGSLSSWTTSFASWVSAAVVGVLSLLGVRGKNAVSPNVFVPLIGGVARSIVLVCCILVMFYPPGAHSIDIQVPGRPRSLLFTPRRYDYASQNTTDFLNQRKAGLCMVTQGDQSVLKLGQCQMEVQIEH